MEKKLRETPRAMVGLVMVSRGLLETASETGVSRFVGDGFELII